MSTMRPITTAAAPRKPVLGIVSIITPFLGFIITTHLVSDEAHLRDTFQLIEGTSAGSLIGLIFALIALVRNERYKGLAFVGLILNSTPFVIFLIGASLGS